MKLFKISITILLFIFNCKILSAEVRKLFIENNEILSLEGNFIQGGLVQGKSSLKINIIFMKKNIYQDKDGRFVLGFGRDFPKTSQLKIKYNNNLFKKEIHIKKQNYKIQSISGLPKKMVTPPDHVYKRIIRENKSIARVRALNSKLSFIFQKFIWPVNGIITGVFGSQRILNGKPRRPHYGIDIAAKRGTRVLAPIDGVVRLAEEDLYFTGGTIMLDHGHGVTSIYSHLSKLSVKNSQKVKKGDVIGLVGSTGRSTGPHLDWRINWFDQRLDPYLFVKSYD